MRTLFLTTALVIAGTAAPALAQDAAPFEGPRVEAIVGWDKVDDKGGTPSSSSDGVTYGGAFGYDFRSGAMVFGPEVELTGSTTDTRTPNVLAVGDELKIDAGRDIYAGLRVGAVLGESTLLYAKGGYTNARVNYTYTLGTTTIADGENLDGWRLGAGIEQSLGRNLYVKGEYRYSNYGAFDDYGVDVDRHQVVAGVGFRF